MKRYLFEKTVKVQVPAIGKNAAGADVPTVKMMLIKAGTMVREDEIVAGCLASLKRLKQVREITEDESRAAITAMGGVLVETGVGKEFAALVEENRTLRARLVELEIAQCEEQEEAAKYPDPVLATRQDAAAEIERLRARVAELEAAQPPAQPAAAEPPTAEAAEPQPEPEPEPQPEPKPAKKSGKK